MNIITAINLSSTKMDMELPTTLYASNGHSIHWLGITIKPPSVATLISSWISMRRF